MGGGRGIELSIQGKRLLDPCHPGLHLGGPLVRKILSATICSLLFFTLFIGIDLHFDLIQQTKGAVVYVGGGGPGNHSTIQEGINAANTGDTVFVYSGQYGYTIVNKTINLVGENKETTKIGFPPPFPSSSPIIDIAANWTNMT
jgi:hypothetical protein